MTRSANAFALLAHACALAGICGSAFAQAPPTLTLKDAEQRALAGHPGILAAQASAQAAAQVELEAKSAYWPTLVGNVTGAVAPDNTRITAGGLNNPSVFDRVALGVTASQLVTDFGRTSALVQTQALRAEAQRHDVTLLRAVVLLDVDRAYFDAQRALAVQRVAQQTVDARQLVVDQVGALASSGLKSGLDLSFARVNLSQAQLLRVQAEGDVQAAFAALATAMGAPRTSTFNPVDVPIESPVAGSVAPMIADALRDRPDVAAERLAAQAAARFADAERALLRPTVAAVGTVGITPHRDPAIVNQPFAAAGFNVTVPVFTGGLFSSRRSEAMFRAEVAAERLRDLENRVARDVTLAWVQVRTGVQRVDLTRQLLGQATDALDLAQQRYNLGLSSIVELTQAQLNKTEAEIAEATARYDFQVRAAALRFQTGALK